MEEQEILQNLIPRPSEYLLPILGPAGYLIRTYPIVEKLDSLTTSRSSYVKCLCTLTLCAGLAGVIPTIELLIAKECLETLLR